MICSAASQNEGEFHAAPPFFKGEVTCLSGGWGLLFYLRLGVEILGKVWHCWIVERQILGRDGARPSMYHSRLHIHHHDSDVIAAATFVG